MPNDRCAAHDDMMMMMGEMRSTLSEIDAKVTTFAKSLETITIRHAKETGAEKGKSEVWKTIGATVAATTAVIGAIIAIVSVAR